MDDAYEQGIIKDIAEHGWSGMIIEEDENGPGFEYSIGLEVSHAHPEVIVFGLPQEITHRMLWNIYTDIEEGRSFAEEGLYEGIVNQFACYMKRVHMTQHDTYFGYALWHRDHIDAAGSFSAMQCVWPDRDGAFPFEAGCDAGVVELQPDLSVELPKEE